jgi:hypothetical protein
MALAIIDRTVLPATACRIGAGRRRVFTRIPGWCESDKAADSAIAACIVLQSGTVCHPEGLPADKWFVNVDSLEDLQTVQY